MTVLTALPKRRTKPITGEELLALGDIGPSELIDGRIVTMTPTGDEHGTIEFNLGSELRAFVRRQRLGRVTGGEVGIYTRRNPDRVRAADIAFI
ncbi:MAG: Uma2 family endonuclease, partial [Anaerolineae bacterium]